MRLGRLIPLALRWRRASRIHHRAARVSHPLPWWSLTLRWAHRSRHIDDRPVVPVVQHELFAYELPMLLEHPPLVHQLLKARVHMDLIGRHMRLNIRSDIMNEPQRRINHRRIWACWNQTVTPPCVCGDSLVRRAISNLVRVHF